eukprot:706273-Pleurochrysis_carterae.AAC.2
MHVQDLAQTISTYIYGNQGYFRFVATRACVRWRHCAERGGCIEQSVREQWRQSVVTGLGLSRAAQSNSYSSLERAMTRLVIENVARGFLLSRVAVKSLGRDGGRWHAYQ